MLRVNRTNPFFHTQADETGDGSHEFAENELVAQWLAFPSIVTAR